MVGFENTTKAVVDRDRFNRDIAGLAANLRSETERFLCMTGKNIENLAGACWEAESKQDVHDCIISFFKAYTHGAESFMDGVEQSLIIMAKMIGSLLSAIEKAAPGVFKTEEDEEIGMRCLIRDKDGRIEEASLAEVAKMLSEEELAKMEAELGADIVKVFRDAKDRQEDD